MADQLVVSALHQVWKAVRKIMMSFVTTVCSQCVTWVVLRHGGKWSAIELDCPA